MENRLEGTTVETGRVKGERASVQERNGKGLKVPAAVGLKTG